MPHKAKLELIDVHDPTHRKAIRITGMDLSADLIATLDGVSCYQVKAWCILLYPSRNRDSESVCQGVERRLGVYRS